MKGNPRVAEPTHEFTNLSTNNLVFPVDRDTRLGFITSAGYKWLYAFPGFREVTRFPEDIVIYELATGAFIKLVFEGRDAPLSGVYIFTDSTPFRTRRPLQKESFGVDYQARVAEWTLQCFDHAVKDDKEERCHRYYEESTELVHAAGYTREQAHAMVDYVFGRPVGELPNEVGGAAVTLAALCEANGIDLVQATIDEIMNIEAKTDKIRAKWQEKPSLIKGPTAKES